MEMLRIILNILCWRAEVCIIYARKLKMTHESGQIRKTAGDEFMFPLSMNQSKS